MTSDAPRRVRTTAEADPWWGDPQPTLADLDLDPVLAQPRRRTTGSPSRSRRPRRAPRARTGIGWRILRLLLAPLRTSARRLAASPRVRRAMVRLAVLAFVLVFLACSVGVILINNVVIGRTAELGKLDDERRELRRDNALLGAESAQLSAPPVIFRRAERDLGMVRTTDLPQFVWLDPASRTLTPLQKLRFANRAARIRARRAAAARAAAAEPATSTPAAGAGSGAGAADAADAAGSTSATTTSQETG
jgi:cell division protein FtsB